MNTIANAYQVDKKDKSLDDYFVLFGNREEGWNFNKEELRYYWKLAVKCSASISYGDVVLLHKGELIRAVSNFNQRLLNKSTKYKCTYKKYKHD